MTQRRAKELKGVIVKYTPIGKRNSKSVIFLSADIENGTAKLQKQRDNNCTIFSAPLECIEDISLIKAKRDKQNIIRQLCYSNANELIKKIESCTTEFDMLAIMHEGVWL